MLEAGIKVPDHALGGALHVGSSNDGSVERAAERLSTLSLSLSLSLSASVGFGTVVLGPLTGPIRRRYRS